MIEIKNANKVLFNKNILTNINFTIDKGNIVGIIGENGAGKTTLIRCIVGIYKLEKGEILFNNNDVYDNINVKSKIGYIPNNNQFYSFYKVKNIIKFYRLTYSNFSIKRYNELNETFNINKNKFLNQLSRGMQMRFFLMLNLSLYPDILVLDEPTASLDAKTKRLIHSLILEEVEKRDMTVIISSNQLNDLEKICTKVAILENGILRYYDSTDKMKKQFKQIQVVFKKDIGQELDSIENLRYLGRIGRVYYFIAKGNISEIKYILYNYGAEFVEEIDLNLEDIFVNSSYVEGASNVK